MFGKSQNYRWTRAVAAAATATTLILLSSLAGCSATDGGAGPVEQVLQSPAAGGILGGEEDNFEGRLLQVAIEGLITGASEQAGGDAYGNILSLLGWGGDTDAGSYKEMQATLNNIESGIAEIKTQLTALQTQLSITEDEIIADINDPTAAITEIGTYNDALKILSDSAATPGNGDKESILAFATQVEDGLRIETDVNFIVNAIISPTGVRKPVLDNYTKLLLDKGAGLSSAYLALETYFSQLVYYQIQGVTLVVEAKTAAAKGAGHPVGGKVEAYYKLFRTRLALQVQNFMDNTWRMIAAHVSLAHTSGFLPAETQGIAARAEFLRTQILAMDHFGLRAHAVVTSNHSGALTTATAKAADGTASTAKGTSATVTGPVYDSWKGNKVSPSDQYEVVTFDFGDVTAGKYSISGPAGFAPAAVQVQLYTADYAADPAGKILYGSALGHTRIGAVESFTAGGESGLTQEPGGAPDAGSSSTPGKISVSGQKVDGSFSDETSIGYPFVYGGSQAAKVTIPSLAHAYGSLSTGIVMDPDVPGSAEAKITATMNVLDLATGKTVSAASNWSAAVNSNNKASLDKRPPTAFVFIARPGHRYAVYFSVSAKGDANHGTATASITIDSMTGMQIKF